MNLSGWYAPDLHRTRKYRSSKSHRLSTAKNPTQIANPSKFNSSYNKFNFDFASCSRSAEGNWGLLSFLFLEGERGKQLKDRKPLIKNPFGTWIVVTSQILCHFYVEKLTNEYCFRKVVLLRPFIKKKYFHLRPFSLSHRLEGLLIVCCNDDKLTLSLHSQSQTSNR